MTGTAYCENFAEKKTTVPGLNMMFDLPIANCQLHIWLSIGIVLHPRLYFLGAAEKELCKKRLQIHIDERKQKKGDPRISLLPVLVLLDNPETNINS